MALNSINTNVAAIRAQENIGRASTASGASIARLSSGNRITRAADDVAALSAGTSLRTNVTTLRTALINTSQGASLLQVADGALSQITDILQRQKAIAVQAGAGSLTASERSFLNQEFQNLAQEVDRLASQTNFNGVTLLDGSLFEVTELDAVDTAAARATAALTFTAIPAAGKTVVLNGVTFTASAAPVAATDFLVGASIAATVQNLANTLNASTNTAISQAEYVANGNSLNIISRAGGLVGQNYTINFPAAGTGGYSVAGKLLVGTTQFGLQGGNNTGLAGGDVIGSGIIGDGIINTQNQRSATVELTFGNITGVAALNTAFSTKTVVIPGTAGVGVTFTFKANGTDTSAVPLQVEVGSTIEETLDNFVAKFNNYRSLAAAADDYTILQTEAVRVGRTVVIQSRVPTAVVNNTAGAAPAITSTAAAADLAISNGGLLNNGSVSGITTVGITNSAFVGNISGFEANYTGIANLVNLSVEVGDRTYTASNVNASLNSTVRLISGQGDYFDIDLRGAAQGISVNNQTQADSLASRINTAFATINFTSSREITSYNAAGDIVSEGLPIGSLTGSSFSLQLSGEFEDASIDDVRVVAPLTGQTNAIVEFVVNGVTFRSNTPFGSSFGSGGVYSFQSLENANDVLQFRVGNIQALGLNDPDTATPLNAIKFNTAGRAAAVEEAFKNAFGIGEGGQTLAFQVGVTTSDTLQVNIGSVTTTKIYGDEVIDVLTQESAARASDVLDAAIDAVTSVRAEVGALQSRFDFAAANIESSIQNQEAARGVLLDTDIASESTAFATAQVQLQAGISVLAQANLLPQNLLKLIG